MHLITAQVTDSCEIKGSGQEAASKTCCVLIIFLGRDLGELPPPKGIALFHLYPKLAVNIPAGWHCPYLLNSILYFYTSNLKVNEI